jgi:uncharacterized protein (TIGR03067 family)
MRLRLVLGGVLLGVLVAGHAAAADVTELEGVWIVAAVGDACDKPPGVGPPPALLEIVVSGDQLLQRANGRIVDEARFTVDPRSRPKSIDTTRRTHLERGIYALDGDTLTLCVNLEAGGERPTDFATASGQRHALIVLKRHQP